MTVRRKYDQHGKSKRFARGESCRRMTKIGSGLILVVRAVSLGRALARHAVPVGICHSSACRNDKSPLLPRLISSYLERGTQSSVLTSKNTLTTLAFNRISFRRYCCKREKEDDKMSAMRREPAAEQLTEYRKNLKVNYAWLW